MFESTTNQETFDQCLQRLDAAIFLSSRIPSVQFSFVFMNGGIEKNSAQGMPQPIYI